MGLIGGHLHFTLLYFALACFTMLDRAWNWVCGCKVAMLIWAMILAEAFMNVHIMV